MQSIAALVNQLVETDDRQDLLEYGLLVVLITAIAIAGIAYLGDAIYTVRWEPFVDAI